MLVAALKAQVDLDRPHPKMSNDVIWICQQADKLEDLRNDAIHSPLWGARYPASGFRDEDRRGAVGARTMAR
jgi:hypothetical protein